jgi:FkbM family methyltransferase
MSGSRQFARARLPDAIRKSLGSVALWFEQTIIRWVQGALFDLRGGHFYTDGCTLKVPQDQTSRMFRASFFNGSYEASERQLVHSFVRSSDSVLELGACLGVVSCITNKILADKTRHVVVEGNPLLIPTLQRNRELNDCGFIIENCAASDKPKVTFFLHPLDIVGGSAQRETQHSVQVPGRSWRELDSMHGPFSVLIMDVEGSELDILEGSPELIARYRLIIVELHEWAIGKEGVECCRELLRSGGLNLVRRAEITEAWERST